MSGANSAACNKSVREFVRIKANVHQISRTPNKTVKTTQALDTAPVVCGCSISRLGGSSCGSNCPNRDRHVECIQVFCGCGQECQNQRLRKGLHAKTSVFDAGLRGRGLRAGEDLGVGNLVIDYVGEVISAEEAAKRCDEYEEQQIKHMYLFQTRTGALIDATRKGNNGRYINHSCEPNCRAEYWTVEGRECVGIFTIKPIQTGEEITYDYHSRCVGEPVVTCFCGSAHCRGFLDCAMPGQSESRKRPFSAMIGEELRAESCFGHVSESSRDQAPTLSTETATSSHAPPPPCHGPAPKQPSSGRSRPAKSRSHSSAKAATSKSSQGAARSQLDARRTAKSAAMDRSKADRRDTAQVRAEAASHLKWFWESTGKRTAAVNKERCKDRTHAWGYSLFDNAAIPVSSKALAQSPVAATDPGAAVRDEAVAAGAVNQQPQPSPGGQPSEPTASSLGTVSQNMVTRQASAAQADGTKSTAGGAGRSSVGQGRSPPSECGTHRPAFYKGLQDLLHRLDPQQVPQHLPREAQRLQADFLSAVGMDVSMVRCRALTSLTMLPAFRGRTRLPATSQQVEHAQKAVNAQQAVNGQRTGPAQQPPYMQRPPSSMAVSVPSQQSSHAQPPLLPHLPACAQQPDDWQASLAMQQTSPAEHAVVIDTASRAQQLSQAQQAVPPQPVVPAQQPAHAAQAAAAQQACRALQAAHPARPARHGQDTAPAPPAKKAKLSPPSEQRSGHVSMRARLANARDMSQSPTRRQAQAALSDSSTPSSDAPPLLAAPSQGSGLMPMQAHASAAQHQALQGVLPEPPRSAAMVLQVQAHAPLHLSRPAEATQPALPPAEVQQLGQPQQTDDLASRQHATLQAGASPLTIPAEPTIPVESTVISASSHAGKGANSCLTGQQPSVAIAGNIPPMQRQAQAGTSSKGASRPSLNTAAAASVSAQAATQAGMDGDAVLPADGSIGTNNIAGGSKDVPFTIKRAANSGASAERSNRVGALPSAMVEGPGDTTPAMADSRNAVRRPEASQAMPPPPVRPPQQPLQAAWPQQQAPAGRPRRSDMPPPPPRPSAATPATPSTEAAGLSSDSDIDIDVEDSSPSTDSVTAAWIERQRRCPEPFLSAAEYAQQAARRPQRAAAGGNAGGGPAAQAAGHARPLPSPAANQRVAPARQGMATATHSTPSASQALSAATQVQPPAAQRLPAAATQCSPPAAQTHPAAPAVQRSPEAAVAAALLKPGVKSSSHGVKPPLYPAKRVRSPDAALLHRSQAAAGTISPAMPSGHGHHSTDAQADGRAAGPSSSDTHKRSEVAVAAPSTDANQGGDLQTQTEQNLQSPLVEGGSQRCSASALSSGHVTPKAVGAPRGARAQMLTDAEKEAEIQRQMALYHAELEAYIDSRVPASERSPSITEQFNRLMRKSARPESGGVAGQTLFDGSRGAASQGLAPGSQSAGSARSAAAAATEQTSNPGMPGHRKKRRLLLGRADRNAESRADRNSASRFPPLEFLTKCFPRDDEVSLVCKPASSGHNAATAEGTGAGAAAQLGAAQGTQETVPAQVQHQKQGCIPTSQPAVLSPTTTAASAIAAIPSGVTLSCLISSVQSVASTTAAPVTGAVTEEGPMYNAEGYATGSALPPPSHSEAVGTGAEYRAPIVFCEDEETVMGHSGALPYANTAVLQHAGAINLQDSETPMSPSVSETMETGVRPMPALAAQEMAGVEKEGQPRAAAVAEQEAEAHAETLDIGSDWRCPIVFDDEECSPLPYEPRPRGVYADASMAACATNERHHSVQAAGQADLGGTDTGADSMAAIAQQGLLDIHAVGHTNAPHPRSSDLSGPSQLQHTDLAEGQLELQQSSSQGQAADSGDTLVATGADLATSQLQGVGCAGQQNPTPDHLPHLTTTSAAATAPPSLRQLQQQIALTYNPTWRPGQDPWLPLIPHAPKQNLRAWKTVPNGCPKDDKAPC